MGRFVAFLFCFVCFSASAKIIDPPGIHHNGRLICSHANTVFALKAPRGYKCESYDSEAKEAPATPKLIWKTELPFSIEPDRPDPNVEKDHQWCVVTDLEIRKGVLKVYNCRGQEFRLSQKTGELLR